MKRKDKTARQLGTFTLSAGTELGGKLKLAGSKSSLYLSSVAPFAIDARREYITGVLHDFTKASLIKCVGPPSPSIMHCQERDARYYANVFPHFAVLGEEYIRPDEPIVSAVEFLVDDATVLFLDTDAFGWLTDARPFIDQIVKANGLNRPIATGSEPQIWYFTGRTEIFGTSTVMGKVSASHRLPLLPAMFGHRPLQNRVVVAIDFEVPVIFDEAILRASRVIEYLGLIVGRPQNLLHMDIRVVSTRDYPVYLGVHWSFAPKRDAATEWQDRPHSFDMLLDACRNPGEFSSVLQSWLSRHEAWHGARWRFFNSFARQREYSVDRLIGAANMFDILPEAAVPASVELCDELKSAQVASRSLFRSLPVSPERDSVLAALGRIGKCNLKQKVRHRAEWILRCASEWFPKLLIVTDESVNCRNYYVHGGEARFDYDRNFDAVTFFIDTLEFVFAASDLIEAGWDIRSWIQHGTSGTHPFGRYRESYPKALQALESILDRRSATT
jgi:ApeA N-terminal domain 1